MVHLVIAEYVPWNSLPVGQTNAVETKKSTTILKLAFDFPCYRPALVVDSCCRPTLSKLHNFSMLETHR